MTDWITAVSTGLLTVLAAVTAIYAVKQYLNDKHFERIKLTVETMSDGDVTEAANAFLRVVNSYGSIKLLRLDVEKNTLTFTANPMQLPSQQLTAQAQALLNDVQRILNAYHWFASLYVNNALDLDILMTRAGMYAFGVFYAFESAMEYQYKTYGGLDSISPTFGAAALKWLKTREPQVLTQIGVPDYYQITPRK